MKNEFLGLIFTIFLMTFVLGDVRYDEDNPTSDFFHTNVDNRYGAYDLDSTRVTIFFPDNSLMIHSNSIDLDDGDVASVRTLWEDEDIPSGENLVRVCTHNDKINRCAYRYIDFI